MTLNLKHGLIKTKKEKSHERTSALVGVRQEQANDLHEDKFHSHSLGLNWYCHFKL